MRENDAHYAALSNWIMSFIAGAWSRSADLADIPVREGANEPAKPCSYGQSGTVSTLRIRVCTNDGYLVDDAWCAREFAWSVTAQAVDTYGTTRDNPEARHVIHGGLINHGTHAEPRWSSHT
jgi:hypothetical protein